MRRLRKRSQHSSRKCKAQGLQPFEHPFLGKQNFDLKFKIRYKAKEDTLAGNTEDEWWNDKTRVRLWMKYK